MARSRAVARGVVAAVLAGSAAWGWWWGGQAAATFPARVVDVVDGDTILVRTGARTETVRLLGVDTPETVHPERGVECFGPEASAHTKRRLAGRAVVLERDVELRDHYGRLLAYVLVDGHRFNDELVREGYARYLVLAPNGAHARALLAAELDARRAGRGLWGECPP